MKRKKIKRRKMKKTKIKRRKKTNLKKHQLLIYLLSKVISKCIYQKLKPINIGRLKRLIIRMLFFCTQWYFALSHLEYCIELVFEILKRKRYASLNLWNFRIIGIQQYFSYIIGVVFIDGEKSISHKVHIFLYYHRVMRYQNNINWEYYNLMVK